MVSTTGEGRGAQRSSLEGLPFKVSGGRPLKPLELGLTGPLKDGGLPRTHTHTNTHTPTHTTTQHAHAHAHKHTNIHTHKTHTPTHTRTRSPRKTHPQHRGARKEGSDNCRSSSHGRSHTRGTHLEELGSSIRASGHHAEGDAVSLSRTTDVLKEPRSPHALDTTQERTYTARDHLSLPATEAVIPKNCFHAVTRRNLPESQIMNSL